MAYETADSTRSTVIARSSCDEQSSSSACAALDCFASLAMTVSPAGNLQRQLRLAPRVAFCCRRRGRGAGAHKAPADAGGSPRILLDHDLRRAARAVIAGEENAVLQLDLVVQRLEGPDVAVGQHQHHAAGVAE